MKTFLFCIKNIHPNFAYMKRYIIILILITPLVLFGQKTIPFTIDIRPRVIDDAKVLVNVEVVNHIGRPVDYLEGFISEFSAERNFVSEKRMVLIYHYEPALQTGFSTTKTISYDLDSEKPSIYEFNISKVKFEGENRVFAWHPKSGFIRID